jgi:hypothetical protein
MKLTFPLNQPLPAPWRITQIGQGFVTQTPDSLILSLPASSTDRYHDAQITDYAGKHDFIWHPPIRLSITARFSTADLRGTAGFGFWNHPFVPGERGFRLPQAVWFFFSSPPSNMRLAKNVPGPGWKAATIDATRWQFLALTPTAPIGVLLMRVPPLYQRLWPIGQHALGVSECLLDSSLLIQTHTYTLDWRAEEVQFAVDGGVVHQTPSAPHGRLGFIAWIDNQYAIVTPQGQFGFGLTVVQQEQSLIIESLAIEPLTAQ